ncbi:alpha/beta-hydrolase, partial [Penicillium daleae]
MTLPTIVFIPGAWHTCEYYKHVISILTAKGFPTATVDLPSVGGISPMADDAAIQKVTSELASDGQKIILVMHSYGGIPGTEQRACSENTLDGRRDERGKCGKWSRDGKIFYDRATAIERFYHDFRKDESPTAWAMNLKAHSAASFSDPLTYAAHRDIPAIYLLCEQDKSLPLGIQELFVSYAEGKVTTRSCSRGTVQ